MSDFLSLVTEKLGVDAGTAQAATGGLMSALKDKLPSGDFSELTSKIPDLAGLAEAGAESSSGGGLLGGLTGAASSLMGGGSGAGGLLGTLVGSGLDAGKVGPFIQTFIGFVKDKAGDGLVDKLKSSLPDLGKLLD